MKRQAFSKKLVAGVLSILTGITGGILSNIGSDLYSSIKGELFQPVAFPVTAAQIIFVYIAIMGLVFVLLDYFEKKKDRERYRRKSRKY